MNEENEMLRFYSSNLSNKFQRLSEILKITFGLDGFWYTLLTPNGNFFQIGNQPGVGETYFGNQLYLENPLFCHPENYIHNLPIITSDFNHEGFHTAQKIVQSAHGFSTFFCYPKKKAGEVHLFYFSSSRGNLPLHSIFLQNNFALSRFCDYFLSIWKDHSTLMERYTFNIGNHLGKNFYKKNSLPLFVNKNESLCHFSKELGFLNRHSQVERLSKRERECIPLLLQGKTAPQMGEILGLKKGTIFDYIDNIKLKMGASNKNELIEILYECQQLNILNRMI